MSSASLFRELASARHALIRRLGFLGRPRDDRIFDDPASVARTLTYLFGVGATLVLATLALPHDPDRNTAALLAIAAAAYAAAGGFLVVYDRVPRWVFDVAPFAGTLLISLGIYFAGPASAAAYSMYYCWVVLAACWFLRPAVAAAHLVLAVAAYGVVLLVVPGDVAFAGLKWTVLTGTVLVLGALLLVLRGEIEGRFRQLTADARTDSLTGLANRRELEERFAAELERSTRTGRPLSILVLDLDWFKEFNDRFGHSAGDRALVEFAEALRRATRTSDVLARLGGEEFAVLAPESDEEEGRLLAERLRAEVKTAFSRGPERMTVSSGVASFPVHGITPGELLHAADRALYEAKEFGRDRVVVHRHVAVPGEQEERIRLEQTSPRLASLVSLAEAVDRRKGSPANSRRVGRFAQSLAESLNLPQAQADRIRIAAILRDVGEVGVAESILNKAAPLSVQEWQELERHPEIGARIVGAAQLGRVGEWILSHHERPDGRGYPRGLREHQIPLEALILAVADAYAAMTVSRPYRVALSEKRARAELQARAGSQFDHDVVAAFLSIDEEAEQEPHVRAVEA